MNENRLLLVMSLASVVLGIFHLSDDIVRGFEPGKLANLVMGTILTVVWLYATLLLAGRPAGYVAVGLFSLLGMFVPYVHMNGRGVGIDSRLAGTSGHFFFVFTLLTLGVTSLFSVILCGRGLWSLRQRKLGERRAITS